MQAGPRGSSRQMLSSDRASLTRRRGACERPPFSTFLPRMAKKKKSKKEEEEEEEPKKKEAEEAAAAGTAANNLSWADDLDNNNDDSWAGFTSVGKKDSKKKNSVSRVHAKQNGHMFY